MANFRNLGLFSALLLLSTVTTLHSIPGTPLVFTLKRTTSAAQYPPILALKPPYPPNMNPQRNFNIQGDIVVDESKTNSKVILLESKVMLLEKKVLRLEKMIASTVEILQNCDDIALLEKNTCSSVVYNEALTETRPLRLLRSELKIIEDKFIL